MKLRSAVPMKVAKYGYIIISAVFTLAGLLMIVAGIVLYAYADQEGADE